MFRRVTNFVKSSRPAQFALTFFAGAIFAAVFYPTREIRESLEETHRQEIAMLKQQHGEELSTQKSLYQKLVDEYQTYKTDTSTKLSELTNQVKSLKRHTKTTITRIVHPDGTVEEHNTTESDEDQTEQLTRQMQEEWQQKTEQAVQTVTKEMQQQMSTMQAQWTSKEQSYQQQISTLEKSRVEIINPKNFTLDVGLMNNMDYYGHVTYNFWGPFIIGGQAQFGKSPGGGLGLGLRF